MNISSHLGFRSFVINEPFTQKWSMLLSRSDNHYFIDEPLSIAEFSEIPSIVRDGKDAFSISKISDRLTILSAFRSIAIPSFIPAIANCFHSVKKCSQSLTFTSSIEVTDGFLDFQSLEVGTVLAMRSDSDDAVKRLTIRGEAAWGDGGRCGGIQFDS
jgi:hypothetical protein